MSLIASLAQGNGALSDLEVLGWDRAACELLGLTERPSHPRCAGFLANQAYYECALIAQLLVRAIQHRMLPEEARDRSLGYVIRHLMRTVAVLVKTGGRRILKFARSNWELTWLYYAADRFGDPAAI